MTVRETQKNRLATVADTGDTGIGGITITGTPTVGQVPTATSSTTGTWQTPAAGGGGTGTGMWLVDNLDGTATTVLDSALNAGRYYVDDPQYGAAFSETARAAAVAAMGANPGVLMLGPGTYNWSGTTTLRQGQGIVGTGSGLTTINYTGSGDCIRARDSRAYVNSATWYANGCGPGLAGPIKGIRIDGTSAGSAAKGIHVGDLHALDMDVQVRNFTGATAVGIHFDNTVTWTERANVFAEVDNCTDCIVFEKTTGFPSFDYGWFKLSVSAEANQDGLIVKNGVDMLGIDLSLIGNFNTGTTNTGTAVTIGTSGGDGSTIRQSHIEIKCETGGATGVGHKTFNIGAAATLFGHGGLNFIAGNGVAFQDGNALGRVGFTGRINVDGNLGTQSFWQGQRTLGVVTGSGGAFTAGGGTATLFLGAQGNYFLQTLGNGAHTLTLDTGTPALAGQTMQSATYEVFIKQPASGAAGTITWPGSVKWPGGTPPTLSGTNNAVNWVQLVTYDHTTFYGMHKGVMS